VLLALHRLVQIGCQCRHLLALALLLVLFEFWHDLRSKELERLADVCVPILPTLLDKNNLIHPGCGKAVQVFAQLLGCTTTALAALIWKRITHGQIALPDIAASWLVLAKSLIFPFDAFVHC